MKRIVIRAGFMIILILCLFACASADRLREGDWEYEFVRLDDIKAVKITGYNPMENPPQTLIVPDELGGCPVRRIGAYCFGNYRHDESWKSYEITSPETLVLPAGILSVDSDAIGFSGLEEIRIENGTHYDTVDGVLFERATNTLVTYPCGKKDTTYAIPEGTQIVGSKAFGYVKYLGEIRVPETVRIFRKDAFRSGYLHLNIPESMETIEEGAFSGSVMITSASPRFRVTDDCLIDTETKTLLTIFDRYGRYNVRTYIIPEGVEKVAAGALDFIKCNRFIFPSTLKEIGNGNSLYKVESTILVFPEGLETIGDSFSVFGVKKLVFPFSLRSVGSNCFCDSEDLEAVEFREGLKSIGKGSFRGNGKLKSVKLPVSLKTISDNDYSSYFTFSECPNLTAAVELNSEAEDYCREHGIPFRYPAFGLWQADSKEAEKILSLRGAENVRIRLDKNTLELTYLLNGTEEGREIFEISWHGLRLEMSEGYMEYTLVETFSDDNDLIDEQLVLTIGEEEMHLTRIGEEQ